jgi:3-isopropylmalate/(R)-2-methylmalate dehydratase small subunit
VNPVRVIEGRAAPLDRSDVDTDQIIPSDWLKRVERTGFGRGLFSEWRDEASFVLNQPEYQGATILLGGARFGTGSSREHAVWALMDYGFRAVVASSFGDIFKNNAAQQGLVTVELDPGDLAGLITLVREHPSSTLTIDVAAGTIECAERDWLRHFTLAPLTRERLLHGWDDIALTLRHEDQISDYEARHDALAPSLSGLFDSRGRVVPTSA